MKARTIVGIFALTLMFLGLSISSDLSINIKKKERETVEQIFNKVVATAGNEALGNVFLEYDEESDEINAYATYDGDIIITKGLYDLATDDELAFVIGHELAHHTLGHFYIDVAEMLLESFPEVRDNDIRVMESFHEEFITSEYREYQSDLLGQQYAVMAGYDPCAGESLERKFIDTIGFKVNNSTHPNSYLRAATMAKLCEASK